MELTDKEKCKLMLEFHNIVYNYKPKQSDEDNYTIKVKRDKN